MSNGPAPKPASKRQRRNRKSSARKLEADGPNGVTPADLGPHPDADAEWHPRTLEFWDMVWSSPMAKEYLDADVQGLRVLMVLDDQFWKKPSATLAAEVRRQREAFGLTPIDRARLQWEVVRTEEAERKRRPKPPAPVGDPRQALRAV